MTKREDCHDVILKANKLCHIDEMPHDGQAKQVIRRKAEEEKILDQSI